MVKIEISDLPACLTDFVSSDQQGVKTGCTEYFITDDDYNKLMSEHLPGPMWHT